MREISNFHGLSIFEVVLSQSQFVWVNLKTFICFEDFGDFNPIDDTTRPTPNPQPLTPNKPIYIIQIDEFNKRSQNKIQYNNEKQSNQQIQEIDFRAYGLHRIHPTS